MTANAEREREAERAVGVGLMQGVYEVGSRHWGERGGGVCELLIY